jgi:endoglucanase
MTSDEFDADFADIAALANPNAVTGNEGAIREVLKTKLSELVDEVHTDSMGNLFALLKGDPGTETVMLDAHMDEIGFMVNYIDDNGFLRVVAVGGQNIRILPGARVIVHGVDGTDYPGVFGERAIHLMKPEDRKKTSELHQLFVDVGARKAEDLQGKIAVGDFLTLCADLQRFRGGSRVFGKALDDRIGCHVVVKALERIKASGPLPFNVVAVFAVQEEIGTRGAIVAAYAVNPTLALALEVTHANDFPESKKTEHGAAELTKGPVVAVGPNLHPRISAGLIAAAKAHEIPFQVEAAPRPTGTDARSIQLTREGVPVGLLSIPLRYMHTAIETIDLVDVRAAIDLVAAWLRSDLGGTYEL